MSRSISPFRLKRPCGNCPFRTDGKAIGLMAGRLDEITTEITTGDGKPFFCHKTLSGEPSDERPYTPGDRDAICAGALIYQLKVGRVPIPIRLAFSLGEYSYEDLMAHADTIIEPSDLT